MLYCQWAGESFDMRSKGGDNTKNDSIVARDGDPLSGRPAANRDGFLPTSVKLERRSGKERRRSFLPLQLIEEDQRSGEDRRNCENGGQEQ